MKPIRDLLGIGRTDTGAFSIETAPVTRNGRDSRVLLQPGRQGFTRPVRKQINNPVQIQIHQNRAIILSLAPCPVIDSQMLYGGSVIAERWRLPDRRRTVSSLVSTASRISSLWPGRPPAT